MELLSENLECLEIAWDNARQYCRTVLEDELEVLLASDASTLVTGAAAFVAAGVYYDMPPGIAHA